MIRGQSISLRPVNPGDLRQLRAWEQAPAVSHWLTTMASALDARESPEQEYERLLRTPRVKLLAIETLADAERDAKNVAPGGQSDGKLVGLLRLHDLDFIHRNAQVRLFIAPDKQGRGYGGDALRTVARYCFEELGLNRLSLVVRADHEQALRLYTRLGFQVEGRECEAAWSAGNWVDFLRMGLLAREWRAGAANAATTATTATTDGYTHAQEGE
ncbi:MAG TPA: GNAT family protein [Ktedonobacterales bacterium]|jgi:RimJ/RimL family protein N-acetyltransferase|nr:GNAT family protein [Ktedonobacterales bacterium]